MSPIHCSVTCMYHFIFHGRVIFHFLFLDPLLLFELLLLFCFCCFSAFAFCCFRAFLVLFCFNKISGIIFIVGTVLVLTFFGYPLVFSFIFHRFHFIFPPSHPDLRPSSGHCAAGRSPAEASLRARLCSPKVAFATATVGNQPFATVGQCLR